MYDKIHYKLKKKKRGTIKNKEKKKKNQGYIDSMEKVASIKYNPSVGLDLMPNNLHSDHSDSQTCFVTRVN